MQHGDLVCLLIALLVVHDWLCVTAWRPSCSKVYSLYLG